MDSIRLNKEVGGVLGNMGLMQIDEETILEEFITIEPDEYSDIFSSLHLPENKELWLGAGSIENDESDIAIYAIGIADGSLYALVAMYEDGHRLTWNRQNEGQNECNFDGQRED